MRAQHLHVHTVDHDVTPAIVERVSRESHARLASPGLVRSAPPRAYGQPVTLKTPLLPAGPAPAEAVRVVLTVLTGLDAGRHIVFDGKDIVVGRAADADLVLDDPGISRRHLRVSRSTDGGFSAQDLDSTNGTYVRGTRVHDVTLASGDLIQLGPECRLRFAVLDEADELLLRQLYESAIRDPLTRARNRRYFMDRLRIEVGRAKRSKENVAAMVIDLDRFKSLNDGLGHLAGDRALAAVAARLAGTVRAEDLLARYGGDEFVVLACGATHEEVLRLAERMRRAVEELRFGAGGHTLSVTVSIGVASLTELPASKWQPSTLLALADGRLFAAKKSGRNLVQAT